MRRIFVFFVLLFLLLLVVSFSMATAQGAPVAPSFSQISPTPTPNPLQRPLPQSIFLQPIDPQTIDTLLVPVGGNAGSDLCQSATDVTFVNTAIGGVTPNVQTFNHDNNDPALSCIWPGASRPNGYRTVWYKFTPLTNVVVTINTDTSNYDTVVGVFTSADEANPCLALQSVACNDDFSGFTSQVTFTAVQDQTYYVVIADWSAASSGQMTLNIFMQPQPGEEKWELVDNNPGGQVTHHDTVPAGEYIYIVGGQDNATGAPIRSNRLMRYHPPTNSWTQMATIAPLPVNTGLSDLTAVHINGRIYVPGGDDGSPNAFSGVHYVYNINNDFWAPPLPSPPVAVGWAQAVAAADGSGYFLIGGLSQKPALSPTVSGRAETYFFDIADNTWLPRPSLNTGRYGHMAARIGNRVCVVGGVSGNVLLRGGECLAPFSNWQPIGDLNIPRFGAGSAVGPDGNWYIFGGMSVNANGQYVAVSSTEIYNPATNSWSVLNVPYDLRDPNTVFARAYPAGEFMGNHLYVLGGNHYVPGLNEYQVVPLVQRLYVPSHRIFIPFATRGGASDFDDNMGAAKGLPFNFWYGGNFNSTYDFYDFYFFDVPEFSGVSVQLTGIPAGSNYDLFVFGSAKLLWGSSVNAGNQNETVNLSLGPGRYYVLVQRLYGPSEGADYQVAVLR